MTNSKEQSAEEVGECLPASLTTASCLLSPPCATRAFRLARRASCRSGRRSGSSRPCACAASTRCSPPSPSRPAVSRGASALACGAAGHAGAARGGGSEAESRRRRPRLGGSSARTSQHHTARSRMSSETRRDHTSTGGAIHGIAFVRRPSDFGTMEGGMHGPEKRREALSEKAQG